MTASSVVQRYDRLVQTGEITSDPAQLRVARRLDRALAEIAEHRLAVKSSALGWLFSKRREPTRGVYIHGRVGGGKTMLMDMFFECLGATSKRRVHFNDFMADAQDRINAHRQAVKLGQAKGDDPIAPVAKALACEAQILCFDEFGVTDIADAMIISRLFSALFSHGVTLVATSNVAPDDLYRDGLNRQLFLPFLDILKNHADIVSLDAPTDYRLQKLKRLPVYLCPLGAESDRRMDEAWRVAVNGTVETAVEISVKGRALTIPRTARRAARFSFDDLCGKPLGARDFLAIAGRFDAIFIDHIPVLTQARRNEAKRFILLIDTLYDRHRRLVVSAAAPPDQLYSGTSGAEAFEFARTASRLVEMQSPAWLESAPAA